MTKKKRLERVGPEVSGNSEKVGGSGKAFQREKGRNRLPLLNRCEKEGGGRAGAEKMVRVIPGGELKITQRPGEPIWSNPLKKGGGIALTQYSPKGGGKVRRGKTRRGF